MHCDAIKWRSFIKNIYTRHVCDHVQCHLSKSHAFLICKRLLRSINNYCVIIILAFKAIYFVLNIWQLWSTGSPRSEGQMWNSGHCRTSLEVSAAELTLPSVWPPTYKFTIITFTRFFPILSTFYSSFQSCLHSFEENLEEEKRISRVP